MQIQVTFDSIIEMKDFIEAFAEKKPQPQQQIPVEVFDEPEEPNPAEALDHESEPSGQGKAYKPYRNSLVAESIKAAEPFIKAGKPFTTKDIRLLHAANYIRKQVMARLEEQGCQAVRQALPKDDGTGGKRLLVFYPPGVEHKPYEVVPSLPRFDNSVALANGFKKAFVPFTFVDVNIGPSPDIRKKFIDWCAENDIEVVKEPRNTVPGIKSGGIGIYVFYPFYMDGNRKVLAPPRRIPERSQIKGVSGVRPAAPRKEADDRESRTEDLTLFASTGEMYL